MRNFIIPRADDMGSFPEANAAIFDAAQRGWIKNISFMVPTPFFHEAVEMSHQLQDCDFGLHVTLNSEWMNTRWGPLVSKQGTHVGKDGNFVPSPRDIFDSGVCYDWVIEEIKAQYDYAIKAGLRIDYMDEHMFFGWVHKINDPSSKLIYFLDDFCKEHGIVWHSDHQNMIIGSDQFKDASTLKTFLQTHQGGFLFMTHPAYDHGLIASDFFRTVPNDTPGIQSKKRQIDYDNVMNLEWAEIIREHGFEILRYSEAPQVRNGRAFYDEKK